MSYAKEDAISWMLHSLKIIIGDESIRQEILLHYHPKLHRGNIVSLKKIGRRKHHVYTFDAFVKPEPTFEEGLEIKKNEIRHYLSEIVKMDGVVVFTATNIQQHEADFETHFQTFIVDNDRKIVYAIDPAYDKTVSKPNKKKKILAANQGIYYAEVTHEVIKPFFEENHADYDFQMTPLSHPAQIAFDDVFCQSWSLYILISVLDKMEKDEFIGEIQIPETQIEKYDVILGFYKRIFRDIPELKNYLKPEYVGEITDNYGKKSTLLKAIPDKILMQMSKEDMENEE